MLKIGAVILKYLIELCFIFPTFSHKYTNSLVISRVTGPKFTTFLQDVRPFIALFIKWPSAFRCSNPFWNASVPNEGMSANKAQNWLPWQRPLSYQENIASSLILIKYLPFGEKNAENRSSHDIDRQNWSTVCCDGRVTICKKPSWICGTHFDTHFTL